MSEEREQKVLDIYRAYQSSRPEEDVNTRFEILSNIQNVEVEQDSQVEAGETDEMFIHVLELYKSYQHSRDSYRDSILTNLMASIDAKGAALENSINKSEAATAKPEQTNGLFAGLKEKLTGFFSPLLQNQWQVAAAFSIAIVFVSVILMTNITNNTDEQNLAAVKLPEVVLQQSQNIAVNIQPVTEMSFGFSSSNDVQSQFFKLGILAADFPVLANANRVEVLSLMLGETYPFVEESNNPELSTAFEKLTVVLENRSDPQQLLAGVRDYSHAIQGNISNNKLLPIYKFGEWLEVTLLTSYLQSSDDLTLLPHLLDQGKEVGKLASAQLSTNPKAVELISELQKFTLNENPSPHNVRKFRAKLQQLKATLL